MRRVSRRDSCSACDDPAAVPGIDCVMDRRCHARCRDCHVLLDTLMSSPSRSNQANTDKTWFVRVCVCVGVTERAGEGGRGDGMCIGVRQGRGDWEGEGSGVHSWCGGVCARSCACVNECLPQLWMTNTLQMTRRFGPPRTSKGTDLTIISKVALAPKFLCTLPPPCSRGTSHGSQAPHE